MSLWTQRDKATGRRSLVSIDPHAREQVLAVRWGGGMRTHVSGVPGPIPQGSLHDGMNPYGLRLK